MSKQQNKKKQKQPNVISKGKAESIILFDNAGESLGIRSSYIRGFVDLADTKSYFFRMSNVILFFFSFLTPLFHSTDFFVVKSEKEWERGDLQERFE